MNQTIQKNDNSYFNTECGCGSDKFTIIETRGQVKVTCGLCQCLYTTFEVTQ